MAVNLVIAITDYDWFQALRVREDWPEVNFWAPSGTNFRALRPGELFLFKLHSPRNYIVGGGVFANAVTLPCSLAWETFGPDNKQFGQANGADDFAQMRARTALSTRRGERSERFPGWLSYPYPGLFQERGRVTSGSEELADSHTDAQDLLDEQR